MNVMEDLKAYVDGELSPERRTEVEAAMEQDERLRQELEELRILSRLIGDCVLQPEPVGLEQTLRLLDARKPQPLFLRVFREPMRFAWVWATACFILLAIFLPAIQRRMAASEDAEASVAMKTTAASASDKSVAAAPEMAKKVPDQAGRAQLGSEGGGGGKSSMKGMPESEGQPRTDSLSYGADTGTGNVGGGFAPDAAKETRVNGARATPLSAWERASDLKRKQGLPPVAQSPTVAPLLIRNGELGLRVANVPAARKAATTTTKAMRGYVEQSNDFVDGNNVPQASLVLRVPEPRFEEAMGRIRTFGQVLSESISGQDVTAQVADTEARLKVMKAEEYSYVNMLRDSGTVKDTLQIRDRLSQVREQIESLDAQRRAFRNQAAYSTITVNMSEAVAPPKPPVRPAKPSWFDSAWSSATERASTLGRWLAEVGMNLLILSPIWVPIVAGLWWLGRRRTRY